MNGMKPRYLAVLAYGTLVPLMKIGRCLILLFVKSICTDFDSLKGRLYAEKGCRAMVLDGIWPIALLVQEACAHRL
jgi:hypothetical protein